MDNQHKYQYLKERVNESLDKLKEAFNSLEFDPDLPEESVYTAMVWFFGVNDLGLELTTGEIVRIQNLILSKFVDFTEITLNKETDNE